MTTERSHSTHFDDSGQARMVDVAGKAITRRVARAGGRIAMLPGTLAMIRVGRAGQGDVLGVARIAAIQAAEGTAARSPLADAVGTPSTAGGLRLYALGVG